MVLCVAVEIGFLDFTCYISLCFSFMHFFQRTNSCEILSWISVQKLLEIHSKVYKEFPAVGSKEAGATYFAVLLCTGCKTCANIIGSYNCNCVFKDYSL